MYKPRIYRCNIKGFMSKNYLTKAKLKAHRPQKMIDWELVDRLLLAGCTGVEVAANFSISPNTFYERVQIEKRRSFTDYSSSKHAEGQSLIRDTQFSVATKDRDKTMLIWLGKQRCEQREPSPLSADDIKLTFSELRRAMGDGTLLTLLKQDGEDGEVDAIEDKTESPADE